MTSPIPSGLRRHNVTLQNQSEPVADGDGDFTQTWEAFADLRVRIEPATANNLERIAHGTVLSTATHVVTGPFHPSVTTKTRLLFGSRELSVTGVSSPDERNREMVLVCVEVVA